MRAAGSSSKVHEDCTKLSQASGPCGKKVSSKFLADAKSSLLKVAACSTKTTAQARETRLKLKPNIPEHLILIRLTKPVCLCQECQELSAEN